MRLTSILANSKLEEYKQITQCIVCMDAKREVLFLPCNHLVMCKRCAFVIPYPARCCICREYIRSTRHVYM